MSKADKIPPTPPSVVAQITQLPDLPIDALRAIWRKLFQTDAPTNHRRFLERRIAYKLQEIAFRKENRNLLQNNQKRIQTLIRNGKPLKRNQDDCPIPGTVLIREYKGVEHRVTVTPRRAVRIPGLRLPESVAHRPGDHRCPVVRTALLWSAQAGQTRQGRG